jgi:hypothetical protein
MWCDVMLLGRCQCHAAAADPGEAVLEGGDSANQHISIPGMDGFFIYQMHFKMVGYCGIACAFGHVAWLAVNVWCNMV